MTNQFLILLTLFLVIYSELWETHFKQILIVFGVLFIFFLNAILLHEDFPNQYDFTFIQRYFAYALIAFSVIKIMGIDFFFIFEKIFYHLTVIGLILFGIQLFFPNLIFSIVSIGEKLIGFVGYNKNLSIKYSSMLIYTYNESISFIEGHRNCSYFYEPGYYALHIVIVLMISLLKNRLVLNRRHIIYTIALFTTMSTTGLIGFVFVILFYVFNQPKKKYRYLSSILAIPVIIAIVLMPIVYEKTYDDIMNIKGLMSYASGIVETGGYYSLGRFAAIFFAYISIIDLSPFFGIFRTPDEISKGFFLVNGFATTLISFGFIGILLMLVGLYRSARLIVYYEHNYKYSVFFFIILVISNFGFIFQMSLIFWIFYFYFLAGVSPINTIDAKQKI